jgi:hypothetical protein
MEVKEVFTNITPIPIEDNQNIKDLLSASSMRVGAGALAFKVDSSGMWLGAIKFEDAPFSVDMEGNVVASSITLSGYVAVGGSAADVNAGATTISGSKLTTGTVTADYVVVGISITAPTITGGTVQTASSGKRVVMSTNKIEIFNSVGASVGTFEGLAGTYASAIQTTIAEINVLAMNAEAIGYTSITKDALIGVDLGDLRLTTMKSDTSGGDIVLSPEVGQSVISYRNIIPNADGTLYLGNATYGWGRVYLGSASRYLEDNAGTLYWNGSPVGGGGEANTASSAGGTSLVLTKAGVDLPFKGISVSSRLSLTSYSTYLYLDHATGSGYNHVPTGGSSGQYLVYSSAGTAAWGSAPVGLPSGGTTYQMLRNSGSGAASWTSSVYVGGSVSYAFYLSGAFIASTVGMAIGGNTTVSGALGVVGEVNASSGSVHTSGNIYTGGYGANEGSVNCALVAGDAGSINFDSVGSLQVGTHLDPSSAGSYNLGGATRYWNDVSYKTLTDRGCLGWFDDGVEMQDGTVLSDLEAIKSIKKHATKKTVYGVPMLDYKTMPKSVYKPAVDNDGNILPRDENDDPYVMEKNKDGAEIKIKAQDGAETTALISIMFGAIKELTARLELLEVKK